MSARQLRQALRAWPYALVGFLYFATWPFHHGLNNPNEMVRVYMTRALVEHQSPVIDPVVQVWGGVDDKAVRDGHLYSSKAPLQSLVGVPVARWFIGDPAKLDKRRYTTRLRGLASTLPGLLFAGVLLAWSRRRSVELGAGPRVGTATGLAIALGTMLYPYAVTFTGHIWAALTAGGTFVGVVMLSRRTPGSAAWRWTALGTGFLAAASPFAEYPAALLTLPVLLGGLWVTPGWARRAELALLLALGGTAPFALGLWAHFDSWGSPFKTGYAFLENKSYIEVHKSGFFGVSTPKLLPLLGALFSPGTGLFFYSPLLVVGVGAMFGLLRRPQEGSPAPLDRRLALVAGLGCAFELAFLAGHSGWRGGWTVGPRYIIAVAPVLGMLVVEALRWQGARWLVPALAAASILITGSTAALYPHLSDVYTNPVASFLWPSYRQGFTSYGLAHSLGLVGHAANMVHLIPLLAAVVYAMFSAPSKKGVLGTAAGLVLLLGGLMMIPEQDPAAAARENERLWGFWEPPRPPTKPAGLVFSARDRWRTVRVEAVSPDGARHPCTFRPDAHDRCSYAQEPWQHFGPDFLEMQGAREPILFMHPIREWVIRAQIPTEGLPRGVFRYGLADASVQSDNQTPVLIRLRQGMNEVARLTLGNDPGLHTLELALTSTAPLLVEIESAQDGARVFGFDVDFYDRRP